MITHGERMQVLEMLLAKRLTVEQADQLLDALDQSGSAPAGEPAMGGTELSRPPAQPDDHRTNRRPQWGAPGAQSPYGPQRLSRAQLLEFKIHGITPQYIQAMHSLGLGQLSPERLIALKVHGVTPDFVREMRVLELGDLTAEQLIELRSHGMTPDYVREMRTCGLGHLSVDELLELRIHGVDAGYIQEMRELTGSTDAQPEVPTRQDDADHDEPRGEEGNA